jgi:hypothetical protein
MGFMVSFEQNSGMFRAKMIVVVAGAILLAQMQCIAACAGGLCNDLAKTESVPPCHRHHDHSKDQGPAPCSHQPVISQATTPEIPQVQIPVLSHLGTPPNVVSGIPIEAGTRNLIVPIFSPPPLVGVQSTVLRI